MLPKLQCEQISAFDFSVFFIILAWNDELQRYWKNIYDAYIYTWNAWAMISLKIGTANYIFKLNFFASKPTNK